MVFLHAQDDFGRVEDGGVGIGGFREAEDAAGVGACGSGGTIGLAAQVGDFDAGPFAPEIDAGGVFDDVGDEGSADAGGDFEEVVAAVFAEPGCIQRG